MARVNGSPPRPAGSRRPPGRPGSPGTPRCRQRRSCPTAPASPGALDDRVGLAGQQRLVDLEAARRSTRCRRRRSCRLASSITSSRTISSGCSTWVGSRPGAHAAGASPMTASRSSVRLARSSWTMPTACWRRSRSRTARLVAGRRHRITTSSTPSDPLNRVKTFARTMSAAVRLAPRRHVVDEPCRTLSSTSADVSPTTGVVVKVGVPDPAADIDTIIAPRGEHPLPPRSAACPVHCADRACNGVALRSVLIASPSALLGRRPPRDRQCDRQWE